MALKESKIIGESQGRIPLIVALIGLIGILDQVSKSQGAAEFFHDLITKIQTAAVVLDFLPVAAGLLPEQDRYRSRHGKVLDHFPGRIEAERPLREKGDTVCDGGLLDSRRRKVVSEIFIQNMTPVKIQIES